MKNLDKFREKSLSLGYDFITEQPLSRSDNYKIFILSLPKCKLQYVKSFPLFSYTKKFITKNPIKRKTNSYVVIGFNIYNLPVQKYIFNGEKYNRITLK